MLTQSRTRPVFKNAKFARGEIISSKEIIRALLGAIVEDERLVKICLCSEAGAHTLNVGDQQGVVMAVDIVDPSLIEFKFARVGQKSIDLILARSVPI
jgi:hypothetical protein